MVRFGWEWSWRSGPLRQPWHSLALALVGAGLLSLGVQQCVSTRRFLSSAAHAEGVVTEVREAGGVYHARVAFVDRQGRRRVVDSSWGTKPSAFSVGESVVVAFPESSPEDARIERFLELWSSALLCAVLGFALSLAAILLWIFRRSLFPQYRARPAGPAEPRAQERGAGRSARAPSRKGR